MMTEFEFLVNYLFNGYMCDVTTHITSERVLYACITSSTVSEKMPFNHF